MKKTYVIDTNVLIQAPYALDCFEDNNLVIPLVVVEELDGLKKADGEKGANARSAVRTLERYRIQGDLFEGIELESGGILRIEKNFSDVELPEDLPEDKADNRILKVCLGLSKQEESDQNIILVTKDLVLRLKAQLHLTEQHREACATRESIAEAVVAWHLPLILTRREAVVLVAIV